MKHSALLIALILLCSVSVSFAGGEKAHVAVAANFLSAMKTIAARYKEKSGHVIVISAGSSGQLYSQVVHGAPYDLLFSADEERPIMLENNGRAQAGSRFTYAVGQLALYSAKPGFVDSKGDILRSSRFRHIAIANPKLAPYGKAAQETLKSLGVIEQIKPSLVMGMSVSQTFQFVASGSAELGFVAMSQIKGSKSVRGSFWVVPQSLYSPINQQAVLLNKGKDNKAAKNFLLFFKTDEVTRLISKMGYRPPR